MLIILFCVAKEMFRCFFFPLSFGDLLGDIMASKRNLRSYFAKIDNTSKGTSSSSQNVSLIIQSSSNITGETDIQYVQQEIKKQVVKPAKHYDDIPSKIKQEIGSYALIHGTKKQLLIVTQKFIQNIHSREQRLMDGKKDARKMIFTPLEKEEDQLLWTMKFEKNKRCYHRIRSSPFSNFSKNGSCNRYRCNGELRLLRFKTPPDLIYQ